MVLKFLVSKTEETVRFWGRTKRFLDKCGDRTRVLICILRVKPLHQLVLLISYSKLGEILTICKTLARIMTVVTIASVRQDRDLLTKQFRTNVPILTNVTNTPLFAIQTPHVSTTSWIYLN